MCVCVCERECREEPLGHIEKKVLEAILCLKAFFCTGFVVVVLWIFFVITSSKE